MTTEDKGSYRESNREGERERERRARKQMEYSKKGIKATWDRDRRSGYSKKNMDAREGESATQRP